MNYTERLTTIRNDYNKALLLKESLEKDLEGQKKAEFRFCTRMEIDAVTECLVQLDTERQHIYEHYILTVNTIHGIAV